MLGYIFAIIGWIFIAIGIVLLVQAFLIGSKRKLDSPWKDIPYLVFVTAGVMAGNIGLWMIDLELPAFAYSFPIVVMFFYIIMLIRAVILSYFKKSDQ